MCVRMCRRLVVWSYPAAAAGPPPCTRIALHYVMRPGLLLADSLLVGRNRPDLGLLMSLHRSVSRSLQPEPTLVCDLALNDLYTVELTKALKLVRAVRVR